LQQQQQQQQRTRKNDIPNGSNEDDENYNCRGGTIAIPTPRERRAVGLRARMEALLIGGNDDDDGGSAGASPEVGDDCGGDDDSASGDKDGGRDCYDNDGNALFTY